MIGATVIGMSPLRERRLRQLAATRLYLCTDARQSPAELERLASAAVAGGVGIVQLRDKGADGAGAPAGTELANLRVLAAALTGTDALLAVNDRADIAVVAGAGVLHLGQDDLPVAAARAIVGPDVLIGRSTHTPQQAATAHADPDVDYFCVGPVWSTPTKPGRAAVGLDLVGSAAGLAATKPWFAIGGIDLARAPQVRAAGADRIVVVRAITEADDPRRAAHDLLDALSG